MAESANWYFSCFRSSRKAGRAKDLEVASENGESGLSDDAQIGSQGATAAAALFPSSF